MKAIYNGSTNKLIAYKGDREPVQLYAQGALIDNISAVNIYESDLQQIIYESKYKKSLFASLIYGNTLFPTNIFVYKADAFASSNIGRPNQIVESGADYLILRNGDSAGAWYFDSDNYLYNKLKPNTTYTSRCNISISNADSPNPSGAGSMSYSLFLQNSKSFTNNRIAMVNGVSLSNEGTYKVYTRFTTPNNLDDIPYIVTRVAALSQVEFKDLCVLEGNYTDTEMDSIFPSFNSPSPEHPLPINGVTPTLVFRNGNILNPNDIYEAKRITRYNNGILESILDYRYHSALYNVGYGDYVVHCNYPLDIYAMADGQSVLFYPNAPSLSLSQISANHYALVLTSLAGGNCGISFVLGGMSPGDAGLPSDIQMWVTEGVNTNYPKYSDYIPPKTINLLPQGQFLYTGDAAVWFKRYDKEIFRVKSKKNLAEIMCNPKEFRYGSVLESDFRDTGGVLEYLGIIDPSVLFANADAVCTHFKIINIIDQEPLPNTIIISKGGYEQSNGVITQEWKMEFLKLSITVSQLVSLLNDGTIDGNFVGVPEILYNLSETNSQELSAEIQEAFNSIEYTPNTPVCITLDSKYKPATEFSIGYSKWGGK